METIEHAAIGQAHDADDRPRTRTARRETRFKARRWPLRVMAVVFFAVLGGLLWWSHTRTQSTFESVVPPSIPAAAAAQSSAVQTPAIAPSPAVQVYIPDADSDLTISTSVSPLDNCRKIIDPPHSGPGFGGVFGCTDFAQPGTDSPSLTVLAGHSAKGIDTAFNRLYVQGDALVGHEVFVRTKASGDRWLVYKINAVYSPDKKDLPYLKTVWGGDGSSTADRLVLVTCRQQPSTPTATHNYVAVAQLEGVR